MLLAFGVVLLTVSFGILISVYSMFFPFFENLKNISEYNAAYYAAISSVERGELVLRYKNPGFQGTGGFVDGSIIAGSPTSDNNSDFGVVNNGSNGMWRTIASRTKNIPNPGGGNVDFMLAAPDSQDFNMIDYVRGEKIILDVDDTNNPNQYYALGSNMKTFSGGYISGMFRLPPKILDGFTGGIDGGNLLCDDQFQSFCDPDGDTLFDEVVVNWSFDGSYNDGSEVNDFSITPAWSINNNFTPIVVNFGYDNAIRESHFSDQVVNFSTDYDEYSPIESIGGYFRTGHNMIGKNQDVLKDISFSDMFRDSNITGLALKFSLFDLLRTRNKNIYPFLEYKFEFPEDVSDRFYNIQGVGKVGDYDIHIQVNKPTSNDTSVGGFTIIF